MMDANCIIVEDQLQAQKILEKHIESLPYLTLLKTFTNAIDTMAFLQSDTRVDIIFLDINLPKLSGLELLKIYQPRARVIITSAYKEYAMEGFELEVADYLLKPIPFDRFFKAVSKVMTATKKSPVTSTSQESEKEFIFAKDGHDIVKIWLRDITYLNTEADFTRVHLPDKKLMLAYSLKFWQEILPPSQFFRCHKSFIVNIEAIERISGSTIVIGQDTIPVGRTSKELLMKKINLI